MNLKVIIGNCAVAARHSTNSDQWRETDFEFLAKTRGAWGAVVREAIFFNIMF